LRDLSETISGILKGKVKLEEDETYAFVPLVYKKPTFSPEIFTSAVPIEKIPFGGAGPLDPDILVVLEKFRLRNDDPVPIRSLRKQILGNRALLKELSEGIFRVLTEHGVAFETDETYAFMPVVFKKPVFDHELFTSSRVRVFDPHPDPWRLSEIHAFADASFLYRVSTLALIEEYGYGIFPRPLPGPLDPWLLNVLERYRIKK